MQWQTYDAIEPCTNGIGTCWLLVVMLRAHVHTSQPHSSWFGYTTQLCSLHSHVSQLQQPSVASHLLLAVWQPLLAVGPQHPLQQHAA